MSQKLPQDIDLNDLLKSLEDSENTEYSDPLFNFIAFYNLKPGKNLVKYQVLHNLYKTWSKDPIDYQSFVIQLGKFFSNETIKNESYFYLDRDALKLTEAAEKTLRTVKTYKHDLPAFRRHLDNFLKRYNIKPGDYWIEPFILYYLYDKWCYEIKRSNNKIGQNSFPNLLSLYITIKTTKNGSFARIDKSILNHITEEQMEEIRQGRKNAKRRHKNEKKSKKQS